MDPKVEDYEHFDLRRPHIQNTGPGGEKTIVQNGFVYAFSIPSPKTEPWKGGKIIGKVESMKAGALAQGHKFCDFCGFIFGDNEGLERHLYEAHRDALLMSIVNDRPQDLKLGELPSESQLHNEAARIVKGEEAEALLAKKEKDRTPEQVKFDASKEKKKGAYRTPLKG